jgi:hypothetical protein
MGEAGSRLHTILMSPQGVVFSQEHAKRLKDGYDRFNSVRALRGDRREVY